jgi:hypothetical protein
MRDDIDAVSYPLAIAHMISFALCITAGFEDRFIGAFRQACAAGDAFIRD